MPGEITNLLADVQAGNRQAESRLASLVYDDLRRMAGRYMHRERAGGSMQATILVHDAFFRLVEQDDRSWQNRTHFFAVASVLMRRLLIDYARRRNAARRGGSAINIPLEEGVAMYRDPYDELLAVDEALSRLDTFDPRLCRIVEMRYFAGMTEEEIGEALGISARTVKRDWRVARAWLHGELSAN
jgi:RNA polymerase sigma factor (TIGR02999 family)